MRGDKNVTACFFGDGAVAEGEFHESLNLAALWRLPVLFVCENNLYAMGTALALTESETDIQRKASCYRIASEAVDGMDVIAVEAATRRAAHAMAKAARPISSNAAPIVYAPTPCSTPSFTATRRRSKLGGGRSRLRGFAAGWSLTA